MLNLNRADVVVHVEGGIATIRKCPRGMRVLVIDEDMNEEPYIVKEVTSRGRGHGVLTLTQHERVKDGPEATKITMFLHVLQDGE